MHGGMKTYVGNPGAARDYVEVGHSRADDYYLTEGTGIARRFTATPDSPVVELAPLEGDGYEAWVAGVDPGTGEPRGRLRSDGRAVRFVEVTVNGPKSWSLAAELHPDIATAYEAAQDRAADQIIGWLAAHATTRVGPRGGQVQIPVETLEAVTVRHYTSRAGDPHRHLHLQINARVFAAGAWRGLHTVGVRDSLGAINGIGHAAVVTDPAFRQALAAHGFTVDVAGEITQLAPFTGAFSARAAQIARTRDRYERDWSATHPGEHPGPPLHRTWDARAWADGRPDKTTPEPGAVLTRRWISELTALGYVDPDEPVRLEAVTVGALDRDAAAVDVVARLGGERSAWNAPDIRGQVEQLIARTGLVTPAGVRSELAEDLTARALELCVPLLQRAGVPEHIRVLTSPAVLAVEAGLVVRLARRSDGPVAGGWRDAILTGPQGPDLDLGDLDPAQRAAVAALAGDRQLIVIEGPAGVGKTTTLAATQKVLTAQGRSLIVVTSTLKAAQAARAEVGGQAGSAAAFAHQHGYRWNDAGTWSRLQPGEVDPVTGRAFTPPAPAHRSEPVMAGDLLVVDEAGMLDQDTAAALLTIADEQGLRSR